MTDRMLNFSDFSQWRSKGTKFDWGHCGWHYGHYGLPCILWHILRGLWLITGIWDQYFCIVTDTVGFVADYGLCDWLWVAHLWVVLGTLWVWLVLFEHGWFWGLHNTSIGPSCISVYTQMLLASIYKYTLLLLKNAFRGDWLYQTEMLLLLSISTTQMLENMHSHT